MLAEDARREDPGDLRQGAALHVLLEPIEPARTHPAFVQGLAGLGIDEAAEGEQRVHAAVAIVVAVGIGALPVALPADAGVLQLLGIGPPARAVDLRALGHLGDVVAIGNGAAALASRIVAPRHHEHAVRAGRPEQRGEIGVTHGKGVGQRSVIGNILALEIAHRERALGIEPFIVTAVIPSLPAGEEIVRQALHHREVGVVNVEAERQAHLPRRIALVPGGGAVGQGCGVRIGKAAHPRKGTEIMIERAILLHQDDDVLDIHDRARAAARGDRQRPRQRVVEEARADGGGGRRHLQKIAPLHYIFTFTPPQKLRPAQIALVMT